jgi:hypothetical protein
LTWEQLETFESATDQELEVRCISIEPYPIRMVANCKDRIGETRRVAVYTKSRIIPGLAPGKVMTWKNPRFHYFQDGRLPGARVEESDLKNIKVENG